MGFYASLDHMDHRVNMGQFLSDQAIDGSSGSDQNGPFSHCPFNLVHGSGHILPPLCRIYELVLLLAFVFLSAHLIYIFAEQDKEAGDDPDIKDILEACCS